MDDTLTDPLTGRLLDGRYAVTARIAHGGMATVYLATDTRLDREVALKVMHAELARDDDFVRRFIGEAKSVARLSHQNVVAVFDQGTDGRYPYLAMEYVPGRTLKEVRIEHGRFTPAAALDIMAGVLDGLAAAHSSGIVHRDVKPDNVLLTSDGRIKVADFGLARAHAAAGHTRTGVIIGTVAYVPPEQVTGDGASPQGDVYSAGVMLFEMLTGEVPFSGDSPLAVAYQHVNQNVPAPSTLLPLPPSVDELVLAATSRDPARRPADAGEFARMLRQVRSGLGEPDGFGAMIGVGVEGLAEAPWLDLSRESGLWRTQGGTIPPAGTAGGSGAHASTGSFFTGAPGAGSSAAGSSAAGSSGTGSSGAGFSSTGEFAGTGSFGGGSAGNGSAGNGSAGNGDGTAALRAGTFESAGGTGRHAAPGGGSHTLIVHREEEPPFSRRRESFLQRWLFSPRLIIVALVVILGVGLGVGGWWFTAGQYTAVPNVAGDTVADATTALTGNGFSVTAGTTVQSNTVQKGLVAGTSPAGRAKKGSAVAILVSAGPYTSTVPVVRGKTLAQAQAALRAVHLTSSASRVGSSLPVGTAIGTNPAAGSSVAQTQNVTILIAGGPALPKFVGEPQASAEQQAQQDGITLSVQQISENVAPGTVVKQNPAAGSIYTHGQTVTIWVSNGPATVPVPDVIGSNLQQAEQILKQAGFNVQVDNNFFFGRVWDYSPVGTAPRGSTISLNVLPGNDGNGNGNGGGGNGNGGGDGGGGGGGGPFGF